MTVNSEFQTSSEDVVSFSEPFVQLADAGFFQNELKAKGIPSEIKHVLMADSERHLIYIRKSDLEETKKLYEELYANQDHQLKNSSSQSRLKKSIAAGILGALTGARVGAKIKGHFFYLVGSIVVMGVVFFWMTWLIAKDEA